MPVTDDEKRAILVDWPDAVWFPGDAPPVGQRIRMIDRPLARSFGTVIGPYIPPQAPPHCQTCSCRLEPNVRALWIVEQETWLTNTEGLQAWHRDNPLRPPDATIPFQTLAYPCSLVPCDQ